MQLKQQRKIVYVLKVRLMREEKRQEGRKRESWRAICLMKRLNIMLESPVQRSQSVWIGGDRNSQAEVIMRI
jgi:hypothetical protein